MWNWFSYIFEFSFSKWKRSLSSNRASPTSDLTSKYIHFSFISLIESFSSSCEDRTIVEKNWRRNLIYVHVCGEGETLLKRRDMLGGRAFNLARSEVKLRSYDGTKMSAWEPFIRECMVFTDKMLSWTFHNWTFYWWILPFLSQEFFRYEATSQA